MGIFDSYFNPQTYGGENALSQGLLQRLADWQWQQRGDGYSPLDAMASMPAPVPQMAATAQAGPPLQIAPQIGQQPPQAVPQPMGGLGSLFGGLSDAIAANPMTLMALGAGISQDGFGKGLQMAVPAMAMDRQNQNTSSTANALQKRGLDPQTAKMVASNPDLMKAYLMEQIGISPKTDDIKEFEYAKRQGFEGGLTEWMQRKRAAAGEYGLNPVYGVGPDGKPTIVQLGKGGSAIEAKMPAGITFSKEPIKLDAGTHFVLLDPITRQNVGVIPKDIAGQNAQEEIGKGQGKAASGLPNTLAKADQSLKLIDEMMAHPGRETATGLSGILDPRSYIPGTESKDFQIKQRQLQGKAFLEAFESLKGGGQITEVEGRKATDAIAALDLAQSDEAYAKALKDLRDVIATGMTRARQIAGPYGGTSAPAAQQSTGRIRIDANGKIIP